jgi:hypothetical protein
MATLQIQTAGTGVVRDAHYVTPTGASAPVRTLLLEPQRTNLCIRSQELSDAAWTKTNATITADSTIAPDGTATADTITVTGADGRAERAVTFTGDGEKCVSVWIRQGTNAASLFQVRDLTALVTRHTVRATWTAGVPALSTDSGAGTLYPVEAYGNGWYRIRFSATGIVAANANIIRIFGGVSADTTGTTIVWGAQAENAVVPSSYIPTEATTVTRNADSLYWDIPALVPREMTVYVRSVNVGWAVNAGQQARVFFIGSNVVAGDPRFSVLKATIANQLECVYDDGPTAVSANVSAPAVLNDIVEVRGVLRSDWRTTLGASVNGGAESVVTSATSSGPAAAFNAARLYLSGLNADNPLSAITHVAIALGTKTRAEMRAIAGVP